MLDVPGVRARRRRLGLRPWVNIGMVQFKMVWKVPATLPVSATSGTSCVRELVSRVVLRARRVASSIVERSPAPGAQLLHLKLKNDYHM